MLNVNSACSTRCMSYGVLVCTQAVRGNNETFLSPYKFHKIQNSSGYDEITNKIWETCTSEISRPLRCICRQVIWTQVFSLIVEKSP